MSLSKFIQHHYWEFFSRNLTGATTKKTFSEFPEKALQELAEKYSKEIKKYTLKGRISKKKSLK